LDFFVACLVHVRSTAAPPPPQEKSANYDAGARRGVRSAIEGAKSAVASESTLTTAPAWLE
jgi:hypothetical protein